MSVDQDFERKAEAVMEARQMRLDRLCGVLRGVVMGMVGDMDAVAVEAVDKRPRLLLKLTVAPEDVAHVVGKKGRTARSLRQVVAVVAARNDIQCDLDITQDKRSQLAASRA